VGVRSRRAQAARRHQSLREFAERHGWSVTASDFRPELLAVLPGLASSPSVAAELVVEGRWDDLPAALVSFLVRPARAGGPRRLPDRPLLVLLLAAPEGGGSGFPSVRVLSEGHDHLLAGGLRYLVLVRAPDSHLDVDAEFRRMREHRSPGVLDGGKPAVTARFKTFR
jgi:hypothetical protein